MDIEIITPIVKVIDFDKIIQEDTDTPSANVMEYVCRVCYNSYDKMKDRSYIDLLSKSAKKGHRSVFEFSNIQFSFILNDHQLFTEVIDFFKDEYFLNYEFYEDSCDKKYVVVTGSIITFIELLESYLHKSNENVFIFQRIFEHLGTHFPYIMENWPTIEELFQFYKAFEKEYINVTCKFDDITRLVKNKKDKIHRKILVELITDKGLHNELVRHRPASHLAESQRYVRYGNKKNPLKICIDSIRFKDDYFVGILKYNCNESLTQYRELLEEGYAPQIARAVLPVGSAMKSFIYCNMEEWEHIFRLRCAKDALPMAQEVSKEILNQFINKRLY
jgi:thymidylate synthase (FAD)